MMQEFSTIQQIVNNRSSFPFQLVTFIGKNSQTNLNFSQNQQSQSYHNNNSKINSKQYQSSIAVKGSQAMSKTNYITQNESQSQSYLNNEFVYTSTNINYEKKLPTFTKENLVKRYVPQPDECII